MVRSRRSESDGRLEISDRSLCGRARWMSVRREQLFKGRRKNPKGAIPRIKRSAIPHDSGEASLETHDEHCNQSQAVTDARTRED